MSDVLKSAGKMSVDLRGIETGSSMLAINAVDLEADNLAIVNGPSTEGEDSTGTQGLTGEEWEREAGLEEVIERVEGGSRDRFEVDSINLADLLLIDLLSDEPVPGVIARGVTPAKKWGAD
ncbi:hypothetical protein RSAG8_07900, partial [Rhizoctonia solani AG-8 WAC10335]